MTLAREAQSPALPNYGRFKRLCRAELRRMGISDVKFKPSRLTNNLIIIVETNVPGTRLDVLKVFGRIHDLGDEYGVPIAVVPALAYRLGKAGID